MRLIDSDELVNYYLQNQANNARIRSETASVCDVLESVIGHIRLMDEIQPKETAKWEVHHRVDEDGKRWDWLECSNCHYKIVRYPKMYRETRFCACCGAKMEDEAK